MGKCKKFRKRDEKTHKNPTCKMQCAILKQNHLSLKWKK